MKRIYILVKQKILYAKFAIKYFMRKQILKYIKQFIQEINCSSARTAVDVSEYKAIYKITLEDI